jgi:hypothetical protein
MNEPIVLISENGVASANLVDERNIITAPTQHKFPGKVKRDRLSIRRGDMLFKLRYPFTKLKPNMPLPTNGVFSAFNGLSVPSEASLQEKYEFAGIAATAVTLKANPNPGELIDIKVMHYGKVYIPNPSDYFIPGDQVFCDFPATDIKFRPENYQKTVNRELEDSVAVLRKHGFDANMIKDKLVQLDPALMNLFKLILNDPDKLNRYKHSIETMQNFVNSFPKPDETNQLLYSTRTNKLLLDKNLLHEINTFVEISNDLNYQLRNVNGVYLGICLKKSDPGTMMEIFKK